jgi:LysR family glycine cleavage system transcriptional activator
MTTRLPSTRALACFHAVASSGNVTRASEQLNMTQGAVSRQLASLEDQLGVRLFLRQRQRLQLTEAGRQYAERVGDILGRLQRATEELHSVGKHSLRVGVEPALASSWLIPHLEEFYRAQPLVDLQLITDLDKLHPLSSHCDLALLYGDGQWRGASARRLMGETLVAVCSRALLQRHGILEDYGDALRYPLVHHSGPWSSSATWLHRAGCDQQQIARLPGPRLETFGLVLQCAIQGLGLAFLPTYFVLEALARGSLVEASELRLPCEQHYYLVVPRDSAGAPAVTAFSAWVEALPQL